MPKWLVICLIILGGILVYIITKFQELKETGLQIPLTGIKLTDADGNEKATPVLVCPFCGQDKANLMCTETINPKTKMPELKYTMCCPVCKSKTGLFDSSEAAINAWNTRMNICYSIWENVDDTSFVEFDNDMFDDEVEDEENN